MRISDWSSDVCSSDLENWRAQTLALPTCPRYHSAMALTLYGIPNCDTVKKARRWLDGAGVSHRFHDFRKDGLDPAKLQGWIDAVGWERLLNKSGTRSEERRVGQEWGRTGRSWGWPGHK